MMEVVQISEKTLNYIKAITSANGNFYIENEKYNSPENAEAFEEWLKGQPKSNGVTLYRGYCFEKLYWEDIGMTEGGVIDMDALTQSDTPPAFTESLLRAVRYMREFGEGVNLSESVNVLFEVKTEGICFVDISRYSYYPEEGEYRFPKDSNFVVENITENGCYKKIILKEKIKN